MPRRGNHASGAGRTCFFALAVVLVLGVSSVAARRTNIQSREEKAFSEHLNRVARFPCAIPQPRSLPSLDVLEEGGVNISPSEIISPVMTVLHRCEASSGCCNGGSHLSCGPMKESEVQLDFKLYDGATRIMKHVVVRAHNHTKCACMEDLPK